MQPLHLFDIAHLIPEPEKCVLDSNMKLLYNSVLPDINDMLQWSDNFFLVPRTYSNFLFSITFRRKTLTTFSLMVSGPIQFLSNAGLGGCETKWVHWPEMTKGDIGVGHCPVSGWVKQRQLLSTCFTLQFSISWEMRLAYQLFWWSPSIKNSAV